MATRELELLENVMMSFAFADTEEKLQKAINNFLPAVLATLRSSHPETKKKVLEVLSHVSKRIKASPTVTLPMEKLVEQFMDSHSSALQKNFTLVYLQTGFPRSEGEKRRQMLCTLLDKLHERTEQVQDILLSLLLGSITTVQFPRAPDETSPNFLAFLADPPTQRIVLEFFLDILLSDIECYSTSSEKPARSNLGMSTRALKRLQSPAAAKTYQKLNDQKLAVLRFLEDHVPREKSIIHGIVSGSDVYTAVSQYGDNLFRTSLKHVDLEDQNFIKTLFTFYEGSKENSFQRSAPPMAVKIKIASVLIRSKSATNMFPSTLKVIFDCASGPNSNSKSQQLSVEFARWVLMAAEDKQIRIMGPAILSGIFKILRALAFSESPIVTSLRNSSYGVIPLVCKRLPAVFPEHFDLVEELFGNLLRTKEVSAQVPISEALCAIANVLISISDSIKERLYSKIESCQQSTSEIARYVGLYFATHVLPFSDLQGRFSCFLATIEVKSTTKDLAERGLNPYRLEDSEMIEDAAAPFPNFFALVSFLTKKYNLLKSEKKTPEGRIPLDSRIYSALLVFLRNTITVQSVAENNDFSEYLVLLENAFNATKLLDLHKVAAMNLTQIFSIASSTARSYADKLEYLWPFLFKGKPETREALAKAVAMILEYLPVEKLHSLLLDTLQELKDGKQDFDSQHGSVTILGMIGSRCIAQKISFEKNLLQDTLEMLHSFLTHKNNRLVSVACNGIGAMARYGALPLPKENESSESLTHEKLINSLISQLKHTNNQTVERVLQALADISLGDTTFETKIIESIYSLARCKHEDILFTSGETLSCIGSKWNSSIAQQRLLPNEKLKNSDLLFVDHPMEEILTFVVKKLVLSSHPDEQVAGSIWLLSLTQFSGKHPMIQSHIQSIQRGFTYMLSSPNEVIQEVGSRGLVLVYEHGTKESQRSLVSSLVNTLASGGSSQVKKSSESELFPEGVLGKTPGDNSKLTTYKELSSLASELGKPELMYKFMNLASHHQLWSSRKGAAFAATTLASSEAKEQLSEHLPSLVPKLYRCSYDPNSRIAQAMNNVLKALLSEKRSLDPYWDGIVAELTDGMGSRQWRVRQASCAALADGLSGRSFEQITKHLERIYYMLFRVIDDIKESVATEALKCSKTLTRLSIQLCDPEYTNESDAKPALAVSLQFLLEKGLVSESKSVQIYSLDSIHKLCKAAKYLISPHVPMLANILLENLSFFEPMEFNYLQQKTEEYGITKDQLENARLAFSNSMPMNDTLDICANHITTENIREVCSKLFSLITNGIGLPTQAGTAKFLTNITRQHPDKISKYSGRLIMKLVTRLNDPSTSLRKLYASTIAYLANLCSEKSFGEFLKKLQGFYFSNSTSSSTVKIYRHAVGICFLELAARASRRLSEFQVDCIPLVFFGTCDTSGEDIKKVYEAVWVELGSNSADRIFMDEILVLIEDSWKSSSWILKQQGFLVIKKLCDRIGDAVSRYAVRLLSVMLDQLKERRIWTGKEDIFPAIASCAKACQNTLEADDLVTDEGKPLTPMRIIEGVVTESKRTSETSKEYQRRALTSVGELLETFCPPLDMFSDLFPYVKSLIQDISEASSEGNSFISQHLDPKKRAEEEKEVSLHRARSKLVQAECFRILGAAWPIQYRTQQLFLEEVLDLFVGELKMANWNSKIKIFAAVEQFVHRIYVCDDSNMSNEEHSLLTGAVVHRLLQAVGPSVNDPKYNIVRESALKALREIVCRIRETDHASNHKEVIESFLNGRANDPQTRLQVTEISALIRDL